MNGSLKSGFYLVLIYCAWIRFNLVKFNSVQYYFIHADLVPVNFSNLTSDLLHNVELF